MLSMRRTGVTGRQALWGWLFVTPAALLIFVFSFLPMAQAFWLSLHTGLGNNLTFAGLRNYFRLFQDAQFIASVSNVFFYLIIQVPIMLMLALVFASVLNSQKLKGRGAFRTMIFLPCATALISSAMLFRTFFAWDGFVNFVFQNLNLIDAPMNWLTHPVWARIVIILAITWRWTGYNTIFYLAGLQNIDTSIYEAARIDGASSVRQFFTITLPLLRPVILLTTIMSTNGTLQIFDEVQNITAGGPGSRTLSISQYIFQLSFEFAPQFGYAATVSYMILIMVATLAFIQMKIGDKAS